MQPIIGLKKSEELIKLINYARKENLLRMKPKSCVNLLKKWRTIRETFLKQKKKPLPTP